MAYWLVKTEPTVYSYADLERDRKTVWDGVKNNLALKHIRAMQKGDSVLVYHTGDEKRIAGIAEIASDAYPDPKKNDPKLAVVDLRPKQRLDHGASLSAVKAQTELSDFALARLPRLSVMPVTGAQWKKLLAMSK